MATTVKSRRETASLIGSDSCQVQGRRRRDKSSSAEFAPSGRALFPKEVTRSAVGSSQVLLIPARRVAANGFREHRPGHPGPQRTILLQRCSTVYGQKQGSTDAIPPFTVSSTGLVLTSLS